MVFLLADQPVDISDLIREDTIQKKEIVLSKEFLEKRYKELDTLFFIPNTLKDEIIFLYQKGFNAYISNNLDTAIENFKTALEKNKDLNDKKINLVINGFLGDIYYKKNDIEKSIEYYKIAINIEPNSRVLLNNLAYVYMDKTDSLNKALELVNMSLELNKEYGNAYGTKGLILYKKKDYKEAIENFQKAIKFIPEDDKKTIAEDYYNLGRCYFELRDKNKARLNFKKSLDLNSTSDNYKRIEKFLK